MTRKGQRATIIGLAFGAFALAVGLSLVMLSRFILYFYDPSAIAAGELAIGEKARIGGLVTEGSFSRTAASTEVHFVLTDGAEQIRVRYDGQLPDLFREGQGVVAEGRLESRALFVAETVLTKHDENYMPKEIVDSLKERGTWQGGEAQSRR